MDRWQKLNQSLERVSAVHDGAADSCEGDAAGIKVDIVHDVSLSQGWEPARMTQFPVEAPSGKLLLSCCLAKEGLLLSSSLLVAE